MAFCPHRIGPLFLRLAAGAVFTYHGYGKLFGGGFEEFQEGVRSFGFPNPEILAQVAAWGEFAGGILLILGLATRLAALVNCGTMFVAIWKVHLGPDLWQGITGNFGGENGYEFPLVLLGACLCLVFTGAGVLSVDGLFRRRRDAVDEPLPDE